MLLLHARPGSSSPAHRETFLEQVQFVGRGASVKHVAAVTVTETRSTSSGDAWLVPPPCQESRPTRQLIAVVSNSQNGVNPVRSKKRRFFALSPPGLFLAAFHLSLSLSLHQRLLSNTSPLLFGEVALDLLWKHNILRKHSNLIQGLCSSNSQHCNPF